MMGLDHADIGFVAVSVDAEIVLCAGHAMAILTAVGGPCGIAVENDVLHRRTLDGDYAVLQADLFKQRTL